MNKERRHHTLRACPSEFMLHQIDDRLILGTDPHVELLVISRSLGLLTGIPFERIDTSWTSARTTNHLAQDTSKPTHRVRVEAQQVSDVLGEYHSDWI